MVRSTQSNPTGLRDRAVLLLGFAGAFRRAELAALNVSDLEFLPEGVRVAVRRSKTDPEGMGPTVAIPRGLKACPVAAVEAWLQLAKITDGPLFRSVLKNGRVLATRLTPHSIGLNDPMLAYCDPYGSSVGSAAAQRSLNQIALARGADA